MAEPLRAGRYLLTLVGAWLMLAPFVLQGGSGGAMWKMVSSRARRRLR